MNEDNKIDNDINNSTPFKWKKHLILPFFGLRTIEEVKNEVHRYKKQDIDYLVKDIKRDMENSRERCSYVISFIPIHQEYKLPNVTISNFVELEDFYKCYSESNSNKYTELWFFKKIKDKGAMNLVGRISFNLRKIQEQAKFLESTQILEQVWHTNHREIEKYNENSGTIFLQASRSGWNRKYTIHKVSIPQTAEKDYEEILKDFKQVVINIEEKRENIEEFCAYLEKLHVNEFSLEYMLSKGKFFLIDWDSSNDKIIVDSLIKNKKEKMDERWI